MPVHVASFPYFFFFVFLAREKEYRWIDRKKRERAIEQIATT